ncbi:hypothetical protein [Natronorubrum halophilum]|uniref:hypothetical protein n=1 Tax=Natronorubrum halophilum TaxID=1702106 RepID=UPI0010C1D104|nr:hypothetical protein [Natronorubrum halophilum]
MTTTNEKLRKEFEEYRTGRRLSEDPPEAILEGGERWFNTTDNEFRGYDGTSFVTFDTTADA